MRFSFPSASFLLFFIASLLLHSCHSPQPKEEGSNKPVLRLQASNNPTSLNPVNVGDAFSNELVLNYLFQTLLAIDLEKEELAGVLASSRPRIATDSAGKLNYTFQLRPEARFADGHHLSFRDVLFSLKLNATPYLNPRFAPYYEFIDSLRVKPGDSMQFTIYTNADYVMAEYACGDYALMPEHVYDPQHQLRKFSLHSLQSLQEAPADTALARYLEKFKSREFFEGKDIVSTAAYQLEGWQTDQYLRLKKKKDWWGDELQDQNIYFRIKAEDIQFSLIKNETAALSALKSNDLHVIYDLPDEFHRQLSEQERNEIELKSVTTQGYQYLGFNLHSPVLSAFRNRKFIAQILPYTIINQSVFNASPEPFTSPFINNTETNSFRATPASHPDPEPHTINKPLTFIYNQGNEKREAVGLILQQELAKYNIRLHVIPYEWSVYLKKLKEGEFDLFFNSSSTTSLPPDFKSSFHSQSVKDRNYFNWENPQADALIDSIRTNLDTDSRNRQIRQFQQLVLDSLVCIFFPSPKMHFAYSKQLKNLPVYEERPYWWPPELTFEE
jgi:peptide/nickel transport system substrate-binding protein